MLAFFIFSCSKNVEDGYRIDYTESPALLTVTPIGYSTGAINDTIHFAIQAKSDYDIKSLIVTSSVSGSGGSGFTVAQGSTDPLIDHSYGTIQKGTKEFTVNYDYIVTQDTADPAISFKLIDEFGEKSVKQTIVTLPSVKRYANINLFTSSSSRTDGVSTLDSSTYHDLAQYASETSVNKLIQKSIDIIFIVENDTAWIVAPYDGKFSADETFIKNKTRFKLLPNLKKTDFENLKSVSLSAITKNDSVKQKGLTSVPVTVGSIVGFFTDYNSSNSYKAGILRVKAIHPSYCSWYTGKTYQIEMDIITQISK